MARKAKFFEVVRKNSQLLRHYGVQEIGVLGSVVKGDDDGEGNDYDVLVVFEKQKKTFKNFVVLTDLLEDELGGSVELVTYESLSPCIGPHTLKEVECVSLVP